MPAGSTVSTALPSSAHTRQSHRQESSEEERRCASRVLHEESLPLPDKVLQNVCDFHCLSRDGLKLG